MKKINLNDIAMDIASNEGKKIEVNIAQIREIIKVVFNTFTLEEIILIWFKHNK